MPRVSVLMCVHDGERYLRQAVDSILAQTLTDFEFVVVDDGSTDSTAVILGGYTDARIVRLKNESNVGLTRSLNRGLAAASGEYVARQDADDVSLPARLEQQVHFLDSRPAYGLVGSAFAYLDHNGHVMEMVCPLTKSCDLKVGLLVTNWFTHGAVMLRRSCLDQTGGYRALFKYAQDYDLWLRLAERYEVANLPLVLYQYRVANDSISVRKHAEQEAYANLARECARRRRAGEVEELDALLNWLMSGRTLTRKTVNGKKQLSLRSYLYARSLFSQDQLEAARVYFLRSLWDDPWRVHAWGYVAATLAPVGLVEKLRGPIRRLRALGNRD